MYKLASSYSMNTLASLPRLALTHSSHTTGPFQSQQPLLVSAKGVPRRSRHLRNLFTKMYSFVSPLIQRDATLKERPCVYTTLVVSQATLIHFHLPSHALTHSHSPSFLLSFFYSLPISSVLTHSHSIPGTLLSPAPAPLLSARAP